MTLLWGSFPAAAQPGQDYGNDPATLYEQAQAETDSGKARELYCQAARAGYGPAQLRIGQIYAQETDAGHDLAFAMLWYDMALLNGVHEAKELRRAAGKRAVSEDFDRYRAYNRKRDNLPCMPPPDTDD